jgi:hypothetical protein
VEVFIVLAGGGIVAGLELGLTKIEGGKIWSCS